MANTKVKAEQLEAAQTSITSVGTLTALQVDNLNLNGNTISTTDTNGHLVLTPNGTGNVTLYTDSAEIVGTEGEAGRLAIIADEADDSGDIWSFVSNTGNTLTIENDKSGSAVSHLTITPHATVASSTVYVPGRVGIGTSAPDLTLHVDGANALPATSGTTPNGMLTLRDKTGSATHGLYMGVSNASPWGSWLQAADAGNLATEYPLLLNPNGGNVGIGTTSTDRNLHIKGSNSDVGIQIEKTGVGELRIAYDSIGPHLYDESSKPFRIYTGGGERLRLDTSGRLLIGITSHASGYSTPGGNSGEEAHYSKLWIQGNTYSTAGDGRMTLSSGTSWPSTNTAIGQIFFSTAWGGDHAAISCKTDGATGNTDYPGKLIFQTTQDGGTTLAERYQIGADGTHNFYQQSAGYGDWRFGFMGAGSSYGYVGDWSTTFGNRIHLRTGSSGSIGVTTFTGSATNNFRIMQNMYYASGTYKAATTGRGTIFEQDNGAFYWVGSNSVSAGATFTTDTLMYLQTDSGHLYIDGGLTENYSFSDLKLKTDIEELSSATENLKKFRAVEFNWKDEKKRREHKELGVIAQEIEKVYPILVEEREKPAGENDKAEKLSPEKHLYVDYSKLTVVLLKAVQEQQELIETLQTEVAALKGG